MKNRNIFSYFPNVQNKIEFKKISQIYRNNSPSEGKNEQKTKTKRAQQALRHDSIVIFVCMYGTRSYVNNEFIRV